MNEQIIQDAAGNRDRLLKIANDVLHLGLAMDESDIVTLEYSFPGGRVDILGTFCRSVLLVEVKQGISGASAVEQVWGYLSKGADLPERLGSSPVAMGVVIAEGFDESAHRRARELDIRLVEFRLEPGRFPFRVPKAPGETGEPGSEDPVVRTSEMLTLEAHARIIKPASLQTLYRSFTKLFVPSKAEGASPDDDERREWICASVKKTHVWIRYKGQGVVCLWAKEDTFKVGNVATDGKWCPIGDAQSLLLPSILDPVKVAIRGRMLAIDEELKSALGQFRWTDIRCDR